MFAEDGHKKLFLLTNLQENDKVQIKVQDGNVIIMPDKRRKTLAERIAGYKGDYKCSEWDMGKPSGLVVSIEGSD